MKRWERRSRRSLFCCMDLEDEQTQGCQHPTDQRVDMSTMGDSASANVDTRGGGHSGTSFKGLQSICRRLRPDWIIQ